MNTTGNNCTIQWNQSQNVFNPDQLCQGELDMAWRSFRAIYMEKKREWMYRYIRQQAGLSYPVNSCDLVFEDKDNIIALDGYTGNALQDSINGQSNVKEYYASNCEAYQSYWRERLSSCYDAAQTEVIVTYLTEVCKEGADEKHPYGSSTVRPGSSYAFSSFEAVIQHVNDSLGKQTDIQCNAYLLEKPLPYQQSVVLVQQPLWSKPDSCACTKINSLYSIYTAETSRYTSFSDYMQKRQGTTISNAQLDSLRSLCNGEITCNYIPNVIYLPPALQCGMESVCIDCSQFQQAYDSFKVKFPDVLPGIPADADSLQQQVNQVFVAYMNQKFGFQKSVFEYLDYMDSCEAYASNPGGGNSTLFADTLRQILLDFRPYYQLARDSVSNGLVYRNQRISPATYALIEAANALVHAAPGAALPEGYAYVPYNTNFTARLRSVIRQRYLFNRTDSTYHTVVPIPLEYTMNVNSVRTELRNVIVVDTDFVADPVTQTQLSTKYYATILKRLGRSFQNIWSHKSSGSYGYYSTSTPLNKYLPTTTSEIHVYTFTFFLLPPSITDKAGYDNFYSTQVLASCPIDSNNRDPGICYTANAVATGSIREITNLSFATEFLTSGTSYNDFSSQGLRVTLLLQDGTQTDAYLFNTYSSPFVQFKETIDSNLYSSDCRKAFTRYFNIQRRTSYTPNQLDSILTANNLPLAYCNDDPISLSSTLILCGKHEPLNQVITNVQPDPCADTTIFATFNAVELHRLYRDSLLNNFNEAYTRTCLSAAAREALTITRPVSEYHYTLYYYDLAGNLVKTIPPEGVHPNRDPQWLQQVSQKRAAKQWLAPEHTMATLYRYNSLNKVVSQLTPDAGKSEFWYDRLGRLAISQNARQRPLSNYSYTRYDHLGRTVEVGEKYQSTPASQSLARSPLQLRRWLDFGSADGEAYMPRQVTLTVYDEQSSFADYWSDLTCFTQKKHTLRNRVSSMRYFDEMHYWVSVFNGDTIYAPRDNYVVSAVDYSYDIHGNVDALLNLYGENTPMAAHGANLFKQVNYRYDLISGKVNEVHYQPCSPDAFFHRYEYDADNRLIGVYTTDNKALLHQSGLEDHEAHYSYYKHGPLARMVLGQQQVQGLDYAYTLQGWLRGVNSTALNPLYDMGEDGKEGASNQWVARDAYGFNLNYFSGDYGAIRQGVIPFPGHSGSLPYGAYRPLYNGNISSMAVNIGQFTQPQLYNYRYDQLNRLVAMDVYRGLEESTNTWKQPLLDNTAEYRERIGYDGNGNILSYLRNGTTANGKPLAMDSLSYQYNAGTNRLNHVRDRMDNSTAHSSNYTEDIDDQEVNNYGYDAIGNLTRDEKEGISSVEWTVYGKIKKITKADGTTISYSYDPSGNRIGKQVGDKITWYARDAQGNVLAVYEKQGSSLKLKEHHLYGSSRLGVVQSNRDMDQPYQVAPEYVDLLGPTYSYNLERGNKRYELNNHLGNVLATISDRKIAVSSQDNSSLIGYYRAEVVSAQDYYPFGMQMPGRTEASGQYRYGFNGKENDKETSSTTTYDYGFRIYSPALGRFLSTDPLTKSYPYYTPYQFAGNKPIWAIDLDGLEEWVATFYTGDKRPSGFRYDTKLKPLGANEIYKEIINMTSGSKVTEVYKVNSEATKNVAFIPSASLILEDIEHTTGDAVMSAYHQDEKFFRKLDKKSENFAAIGVENLEEMAFKGASYAMENGVAFKNTIIDFHGTQHGNADRRFDGDPHKINIGSDKLEVDASGSPTNYNDKQFQYFQLLGKFQAPSSQTLMGACNADKCTEVLMKMSTDMNTTIYGHKSYSYSANLDNGKFYGGFLNWLMSKSDGNSSKQGKYIKVVPGGTVTNTGGVTFGTNSTNAGNISEENKQ